MHVGTVMYFAKTHNRNRNFALQSISKRSTLVPSFSSDSYLRKILIPEAFPYHHDGALGEPGASWVSKTQLMYLLKQISYELQDQCPL